MSAFRTIGLAAEIAFWGGIAAWTLAALWVWLSAPFYAARARRERRKLGELRQKDPRAEEPIKLTSYADGNRLWVPESQRLREVEKQLEGGDT